MAYLLKELREKYETNSEYWMEDAGRVHESFMKLIILKQLRNVRITRVAVVKNPYLEAMYNFTKEEYQARNGSVNEKLLIHSTCETNVKSIVDNNFDWRRVTRSKYGVGVSFSDDADYANFHSNILNGDERAFIITQVLISKTCIGDSCMEVPPENYDTAKSDTGRVYVKFRDNEFLPKYVVFYDAPDRTTSKHFVHHGRHRRFRF